MCGRFVAASPPDEIARYFDTAAPDADLAPRWNVAPTDEVYAVRADGAGGRRLDAFRWGLVPHWADDPRTGAKMINARAETLATKSAFADAFRRRRCIVAADGFYEWRRRGGGPSRTQPHYIHRADGEPLAFAGLWAVWRRPADDSRLRSATIVTTGPNATMAPLHDRMPVVLPRPAWDAWLDPDGDDLEALGRLLVPAPDDLLAVHPVSMRVNSVRNDGPDLVERDEGDQVLF